jgi:hypothetical protein
MQLDITTILATTTPSLITTMEDLGVDVKIEETKVIVMEE